MSGACFAQDSTRVRNRLTETITERYFLKDTGKQVKTGIYLALYKRDIALASGKYVNNKRAGTWHFYDKSGTAVENFDYDNNTLLYEKPDDSVSQEQIRYAFDDTIGAKDHITKPIRPGGRYYGYLPYLQVYKLSDDFNNTDFSLFTSRIGNISEPGRPFGRF